MKLCVFICLIYFTKSEKVEEESNLPKSRKGRIDEVNEDYDEKAKNFEEHKNLGKVSILEKITHYLPRVGIKLTSLKVRRYRALSAIWGQN
jgi:hypothetical protein